MRGHSIIMLVLTGGGGWHLSKYKHENREGECLDNANVRIKLFSINRVLARPY